GGAHRRAAPPAARSPDARRRGTPRAGARARRGPGPHRRRPAPRSPSGRAASSGRGSTAQRGRFRGRCRRGPRSARRCPWGRARGGCCSWCRSCLMNAPEPGSVRSVASPTMSIRAWQVRQLRDPAEVLPLVDGPSPAPGAGQVRVAVRASAVNFADTLMCRGEYQVKPDLPFVPGHEVCGDVLEVGEGVTHVSVGDRVLGGTAIPAGGFATEFLMDAATTFPAPDGLDHAASAALMISYQTG